MWADASYPVRVYWLMRSPRRNIYTLLSMPAPLSVLKWVKTNSALALCFATEGMRIMRTTTPTEQGDTNSELCSRWKIIRFTQSCMERSKFLYLGDSIQQLPAQRKTGLRWGDCLWWREWAKFRHGRPWPQTLMLHIPHHFFRLYWGGWSPELTVRVRNLHSWWQPTANEMKVANVRCC